MGLSIDPQCYIHATKFTKWGFHFRKERGRTVCLPWSTTTGGERVKKEEFCVSMSILPPHFLLPIASCSLAPAAPPAQLNNRTGINFVLCFISGVFFPKLQPGARYPLHHKPGTCDRVKRVRVRPETRRGHQTPQVGPVASEQLPTAARACLLQYVALGTFKPSPSTYSFPHLLYVHRFFTSFAIKTAINVQGSAVLATLLPKITTTDMSRGKEHYRSER